MRNASPPGGGVILMESRIAHAIKGKAAETYFQILGKVSLQEYPHQIVKDFWKFYLLEGNPNNSKNGKMFEYIVCECFVQFGVGPFYFQSQFYGLEGDTYDLASWTEDGFPIIVSCKTSLRERWKQAELEGRLLKFRFPKAESYLVTLHREEATKRKQDIKTGVVDGIDQIYLADQPEFDDFTIRMGNAGLRAVEPILPLEGTVLGA